MRLSSTWQRRILCATFRAAAVTSFRSGNIPQGAWAKRSFPSNHLSFSRMSRPMASVPVFENRGGEAPPSDHSDYEKWVRRLYMTNMFHPVKMGLTNIKKLHDLAGNPMDDVSIIYFCRFSYCYDGVSSNLKFLYSAKQVGSSYCWNKWKRQRCIENSKYTSESWIEGWIILFSPCLVFSGTYAD